MARKEVTILKVLRITPGGNHAWVKTNIGELRKPLNSIPDKVLAAFNEEKLLKPEVGHLDGLKIIEEESVENPNP